MHDLKFHEEQKRDAALGRAGRWQLIVRGITWAETQAHVRRNTPGRCLELQRIQLRGSAPTTIRGSAGLETGSSAILAASNRSQGLSQFSARSTLR